MTDINLTEIGKSFGNTSVSMPEPPLYLVISSTVMYALTFILGLFGNINVIIIVYKFKNMRSRMNYFLVNLSISDMFILLVCIPSASLDLIAKEVWFFGEAMCKIIPFLENVVTLSSVLTILAITWDRYKGICYPLKYSDDKEKKMRIEFLFIWLASIIASIPMILVPVFRDSSFRDGTPIKVCRMPINHEWQDIYFILIFVMFFCMMFFAMVYLYGRICMTLSKRRRFINASADRYAKKLLSERKQMIRLMLMVVIMFFVCLVPQRAISLWLIFANKRHLMSLGLEGYLLLKTLPRVMVYMNSAINPIIYNFTSVEFKMAFKKILFWEHQRQPNIDSRRHSSDLIALNRREV